MITDVLIDDQYPVDDMTDTLTEDDLTLVNLTHDEFIELIESSLNMFDSIVNK